MRTIIMNIKTLFRLEGSISLLCSDSPEIPVTNYVTYALNNTRLSLIVRSEWQNISLLLVCPLLATSPMLLIMKGSLIVTSK
jgi:hypothetical protein